MIDPSIQDSEQVQSLSSDPVEVYLFVISNADDEGRMTVSSPMLRPTTFPLREDLRSSDVTQMVNAIVSIGLAGLYADGEVAGAYHPNWTRYQTISRQSRIADPSGCPARGAITDHSLITHGALNESSLDGQRYHTDEAKGDLGWLTTTRREESLREMKLRESGTSRRELINEGVHVLDASAHAAAAADLNAHIAHGRASTSNVYDDDAIKRISERLQTIDSGVGFFRSARMRAVNKYSVNDAKELLLTAVLTVDDWNEEWRADSARDLQRKAVTPRIHCPRCHARGPAFGSGSDWAVRDSEWELIDSS
jgi:hypothetical protein